MMKPDNFSFCEKLFDSSNLIACKENKSEVIFKVKSNQAKQYKVDGCLISENNLQKCDFAVSNLQNLTYFIELKGSDIREAFQQIHSTIKWFLYTSDHELNSFLKAHNIKAIIVFSGSSPKIVKKSKAMSEELLLIKFCKINKINLSRSEVRRDRLEEDI